MKSRNANHNGRVTPKRQKAAGVISVAALTLGGLGTAALLTAGTASADVASTANYVIGSGSVSNVSATESSLSAGATATYTISFTTPVALTTSDSITVSDSSGSTTFPALSGSNYSIVDTTTPADSGVATAATVTTGNATTPASTVVTLPKAVAAGDTIILTITGITNPAAGSHSLNVSTSKDSIPVSTPSYTITAAAATPTNTATASPLTPGAGNTTYTLAGYTGITAAGGSALNVVVTNTNAGATSYDGVWPQGAAQLSDYTITDTASGGTVNWSVAPTAATATISTTADTIALTLPAADSIASGDSVTVTATGVTNPTVTQVDTVTVGGKPSSNPPSVTIGSSVSNLSVTPSTSTTGAVASYTVSLKTSQALTGGSGQIFLTAPNGTAFSNPSIVTITDATTSSGSGVAAAVTPTTANSSTTKNALAITVPNNIKAGDSLTLSIPAVTNPAAGTYAASSTSGSFTATTSTDLVTAEAASYTIAPTSTTAATVSVTATPTTPGASATYTVTNLQASSAITGGGATGIAITGPTGTIFPAAASDYTITDLTNSAASGQPLVTAGGNSDTVTLTPANNIASGDMLSITATAVTNPGTAGSYSLGLTGPVVAAQVPTGTPSAGVTYPNGGFFLNSGTIYETVGGAAIAVPDLTTLAKLDPGYAIAAPNGNVPTQTVPRMGTLVQALGSPAIWVVGSSNTLYAFTSPSDFLSKGYDPAMVVTVPSIPTSWTTSTSAAPNAATTMSNGAMVLAPNGGIYEYAGGNAFLIPNLTTYFTIAASDPATVLSVTSTPSTSATVANGTLWLSVSGGAAINVEYNGQAQPFSSLSAMYSGGYNPYMTLTIP